MPDFREYSIVITTPWTHHKHKPFKLRDDITISPNPTSPRTHSQTSKWLTLGIISIIFTKLHSIGIGTGSWEVFLRKIQVSGSLENCCVILNRRRKYQNPNMERFLNKKKDRLFLFPPYFHGKYLYWKIEKQNSLWCHQWKKNLHA